MVVRIKTMVLWEVMEAAASCEISACFYLTTQYSSYFLP